MESSEEDYLKKAQLLSLFLGKSLEEVLDKEAFFIAFQDEKEYSAVYNRVKDTDIEFFVQKEKGFKCIGAYDVVNAYEILKLVNMEREN